MANRKLTFGYEIQRGKIRVQDREANLVKEIFQSYVEGASYQELARRLNIQKVSYNEPDKPWNKNMVARILNCGVYSGTELYPAILTEETRRQAIAAKPAASKDSNSTSKVIRQLARCAGCGSPLALSANRYGWARWNCPSCGALTAEATTPVIIDELTQILATLIGNPETVQIPPQKRTDFAELEDELAQFFHSDEFDESSAKAKTIGLAIAQFDALSAEDYETMRIRYILAGAEWSGELDADLLRQITSSILIHSNGAVSLKLKNGQMIERS